jgi:hypothetical protein
MREREKKSKIWRVLSRDTRVKGKNKNRDSKEEDRTTEITQRQ